MKNNPNCVEPYPGTQEALDAGCTCPVLDNRHGKGYGGMDGVYCYTGGCPVHWRKKMKTSDNLQKYGEGTLEDARLDRKYSRGDLRAVGNYLIRMACEVEALEARVMELEAEIRKTAALARTDLPRSLGMDGWGVQR